MNVLFLLIGHGQTLTLKEIEKGCILNSSFCSLSISLPNFFMHSNTKTIKLIPIQSDNPLLAIESPSFAYLNVLICSISEPEEEDTRPDLPWHERRWNRNFSFIFSSHSVALGMVILFSPLAGALVMAYLHLLFFIIYFICEIKLKIMVAKVFRLLMDISNLVLIIIGTVGINYAQSNESGLCWTYQLFY